MERSRNALPGGSSAPGRPTIRAVAEYAGVSKSLVSRVLQGSPRVAPKTQQLVLEAIEALGYQPNAAARSLAQRRSNLIGVVINNPYNPWYVDVLAAMDAALEPYGVRSITADGNVLSGRDETVTRMFDELQVDAMILVALPRSPKLEPVVQRIPTIAIGSREPQLPGVWTVTTDDAAGVRLSTGHLLELGHRRVAHIAGLRVEGEVRRAAFEQTMATAGLAPVGIELSDITEPGGYQAAVKLLSRPDRPTAIVAYNDLTAIGAMGAAREMGLRVPEDVSVVGYDNTRFAQLRTTSLTSVDINGARMGRRIAEALRSGQVGQGEVPPPILIEPELVVRLSSGPAPQAR